MGKNVVMDIKNLNLVGTLVDDGWIENLKYENGKPNLNAIMILSEIVYWYKPRVVKDELTGAVKGYKKKFQADKLQKSYEALADRFGLTKRQAKTACDYLKKKGLITVEFRTITVNGVIYNNVMFVEPIFENLKKITGVERYIDDLDTPPTSECNTPPTSECNTPPTSECNTPPTLESDRGGTLECNTNTEITSTKTTSTKTTTSSSSKGNKSPQLIRLEKILNKSLGKTNFYKFEKYVKENSPDFIDAILDYAEQSDIYAFNWVSNRIDDYISQGITTGDGVRKQIESFHEEKRQAKNRALKQKDEKRKASEEAHEKDMAGFDALNHMDLPDVITYDTSNGELVNEIKDMVSPKLTEVSFNTWIKPVDFIRLDGKIIVECLNNFTMEIIEKRYYDIILEALRERGISDRLIITVKK